VRAVATEDELAQTATATPSAAARLPPAPSRLGKYQLEGELGAGGMGVVHAAFDPDLERRVAIKLLRDSNGDVSRARLLREARAMARLAHPNVVTVYEVGTIDGRDFVAMELFEGQSLAEWLRTERPSQREVLDTFIAAGRGLAAAHAENLVHRDFKPHNVLRGKRGRIAVTDFGLARPIDAKLAITRQVAGAMPVSPMLTATGAVLGTPAYMSPEQWEGGDVGPTTDQFAFCVALWEALAGARPFPGQTGDELRAAIAKGPPDPRHVPRRFRASLRRGLDPHPARRFASMDALLDALEKARRPRVLPWLAVLVPALIIGVLIAALGETHEPAATPQPKLEATAPVIASIKRVDDREYAMPRDTLNLLIYKGRELFAHDAAFARVEGGYQLSAIRADGLFARIGLLDGDVLQTLGHVPIDPASWSQLATAAMADDDLALKIARGGKPMTIELEIH